LKSRESRLLARCRGDRLFYGKRVEKAEDLDAAVKDWLAHPGPALLDVATGRMELVMPPNMEMKPVFGMALYSAKAILGGRAEDVVELAKDNLLN